MLVPAATRRSWIRAHEQRLTLSCAATRTPACTERPPLCPRPCITATVSLLSTRAPQTAPAPAAVPAPAPAPHKLHPPASHEKPVHAAPAPPPHPVCTNVNARVRSTSRQSGAQIAPRRRGMLSPFHLSQPSHNVANGVMRNAERVCPSRTASTPAES